MKIFTFLIVCFCLATKFSHAEVKVYPAPSGEVLSTLYKVTVEQYETPVYKARTADAPYEQWRPYHGGEYGFTSFDFTGSVKVRITSNKDLSKVVIRPASTNVQKELRNDTLVLTLTQPIQISIEPDGKNNPLLLFANAPEDSIPEPNDPNVIYYGPGIHQMNENWVGNNKTIYIAGGAIVKGNFMIRGNNVKIRGRGIICQNDWGHYGTGYPINIDGGYNNINIEGIIIRGSCTWTIGLYSGDSATIKNVKICGGRMQNDDGIDIVNFSNVDISNCFIRTDDDCIAPKGINSNMKNVEHIKIENCVLWCDRARIFYLGFESKAQFFQDIQINNIDVIHQSMMVFQFQPDADLIIRNVNFSDIRINGNREGEKLKDTDFPIISIVPMGNPSDVSRYVNVKAISFNNITVYGQKNGSYIFDIHGISEGHRVEDISFNNFKLFDNQVYSTSANVVIGNYTRNITFGPLSSIKTNNIGKSLLIYPNPVKNGFLNFEIETSTSSELTYNISNTLGALLFKDKINNIAFNPVKCSVHIENFPQGIYILNVFDGHAYYSQKFIANHK